MTTLYIDPATLRASPTPLPGYVAHVPKPEWQPISTAPKDGTDILTYCPDHVGALVLFFSQHGSGWTCGSPKYKYSPTHWMPLPEPPDTCRHCGGDMLPGQAMASTVVCGDPDMGEVMTISAGGPGQIVSVSKCARCGWSVSAQNESEMKEAP